MNIYDIITSKELATYWMVKQNERIPFFGESKFPNMKQLGLSLSWIKGAKKAPVSLQLSAFDAKAIPLSRQGFDKIQTEMPFFKNSMNVDEKQRQELLQVIASGNQTAIDLIVNKIYDDEMTLLECANIAREIMRMQILTTGALSISSNGQTYTYDYGVPSSNKISPTNKWNVPASADPIKDITDWQDLIENSTGIRPTELLMNTNTFNMIRKCDSIKNAIYVLGQGKVVPNAMETKTFILNETGCTIFIYNKGYDKDGTFTKFIADGAVVLMPASNLGKTYFGTTPEEADLQASNIANVSIVDTGVAVTTSKEVDPVNVMTKASMVCLPSFEMAEYVIIADVD